MVLSVLDAQRADRVARLCEAIVPGSRRVGPVAYVDALLRRMLTPERDASLQAIDLLGEAVTAGTLAQHERSPAFAQLRALVIEAYYSDFVAPGHSGPGAWSEIDFLPPRAVDLQRDWSYLGIQQ